MDSISAFALTLIIGFFGFVFYTQQSRDAQETQRAIHELRVQVEQLKVETHDLGVDLVDTHD